MREGLRRSADWREKKKLTHSISGSVVRSSQTVRAIVDLPVPASPDSQKIDGEALEGAVRAH